MPAARRCLPHGRRSAWRGAAWTSLGDRLETRAFAPICVAFSGGSDSLALLRLAAAWAQGAGRPIVALTVDHGLNPQSAEWTAAAAAAAARLGVDWRGLVWTGDKPSQGLPAAARAARHALLAKAARDLGSGVILLGHTADDVAESVLIRADTPGHGRLRAWSPSPAWPEGRGVFLLRPLLGARRADLRAGLSADGLSWLEDPSNADPRFARSRARAELDGRLAGDEDVAACDIDANVQGLAAQAAATADGRLSLPRSAMASAPPDAVRRVVSAALVCAGGGSRPPRGAQLDRLLEAIALGLPLACTLAGARLETLGGDDAIVFARDVGERTRAGLAALRLAAGACDVFDGRFEAQAGEAPVEIAPLAGRISRLDAGDRLRLRAVPAGARAALPAVVGAGGAVSLPAPFGGGPAVVRALVARRFVAACGLVEREAQLATTHGMAL